MYMYMFILFVVIVIKRMFYWVCLVDFILIVMLYKLHEFYSFKLVLNCI
jgi:hypothetical protein